ncbi:unnamed protein product [marine sediment metagenome]|uniref:Uncharacterized protein n=1 Tax=marine sediment metagenome TaxID=412755 RepID=X1TT25_9ZZZZ
MPKAIKYKSDTLADGLFDRFGKLNACAESVPFYKKYIGKTFGEFIDGFSRGEYDPAWGVWLLKLFGEEIDLKERLKVIAPIKDSMTAFNLYLDLSWLTDKESKLLESKFKGKLPTAERELRDGIVKRSK